MPRVGFLCPVGNVNVSDAECVACATGLEPRFGSWCAFSAETICAIANDRERRKTAGISVTMLGTACQRQIRLQETTDYHVRPIRMWPSIRGIVSHAVMENHAIPQCIYEHRFEMLVDIPGHGPTILTGQIDRIWPARRGILDFKSKKAGKLPAHPPKDYVMQLNCYRLLVKYGWPQIPFVHDGICYNPGLAAGIEIDTLELNMFTAADEVGLYPVRVLSEETVWAYIKEQMAVLLDPNLPAIPDRLDPHTSVFCRDWCPVRDVCIEQMYMELPF